jgi:hypothetical protein
VSGGVEDGRRLPASRAGYPSSGRKAISGVACLQGLEGLGMAGPGTTLGSPWLPDRNFPCQILKIRNVSQVVMGSGRPQGVIGVLLVTYLKICN